MGMKRMFSLHFTSGRFANLVCVSSKASRLADTLASLQKQYADLTAQFHGFTSPGPGNDSTSETLTSPNDPLLAADFAHAQSTPRGRPHNKTTSSGGSKTVRFSDTEGRDGDDGGGRRALFPYRDDPEDTAGY